jgi:hypothetical protein
MKSKLSAALAAAAYVLWLSIECANANTVTIQLQEAGVNGGAITTVATGDGFANIANLGYGMFSSVSVTGLGYGNTGDGYSGLFSNAIAASSTTPGTLTVYISLAGAGLPPPCFHGCWPPLIVGLATNTLPIENVVSGNDVSLGWTVQEDVSITSQFGPRSLASATFNSIGSNQTITACGGFGSGCN